MESFCLLCHFMLIRRALSGSISIVIVEMVLTIFLFTIKATLMLVLQSPIGN